MNTTLLLLIVIACNLGIIIHQNYKILEFIYNGTDNSTDTRDNNHHQRGN